MSDSSSAADATTRAAIKQAQRRTPVPVCRPGVVTGVDAGAFVAYVVMDGDPSTTVTTVQALDYLPSPGQRVRVLFYPPSDAVVLGTMAQTIAGANPVATFGFGPGGALDVLIAAGFVTWPVGSVTTFTPPVWAQSVFFQVTMNGNGTTGAGTFELRPVWGGVPGLARTFQGTGGGFNGRFSQSFQSLFPVVGPGAPTSFLIQGRKIAGAGSMSADAATTITVAAWWLPST